jgi:AraC-like DNA-binding protein
VANLRSVEPVVATHDSPLGRWTIARWSPSKLSPLYGNVEQIWYFDGSMTHAKERVFPDALAELIVMLDEPHRDGDVATLDPFPAVCINGLRTRPSVVVAPRGRCRVLGVQFQAAGACALLRSSMKELRDVTIDLRDALGRAAAELGERCADARNAAAVVQTAAQWVTRQIDYDMTRESDVRWAARVIQNSRGVTSIEEIAGRLSAPRARLARRFCEYYGVTPKLFARIVRFDHALSLLQESRDIAAAAAALAYADQSHLYRDFSQFSGMTPGALLSATRYAGSGSVAEL